nr:MAG TPA_asm: hypothetical protein [Caudoviricetes sp.]
MDQAQRTSYIEGLLSSHRDRLASGRRIATAYGQKVRVLTVARTGLRIRFSDGRVGRAHPEDVTW